MARKTIQISPAQVKKLRGKIGITQKQAANLVHVSLRQWQKFEEPESSGTYIRIPDASLELFCLKTGVPFPPIFEQAYRFGKTISFAGGPGGIGRSTLTRDISILLAAEGFEVIIITDETGHLRLLEKRYIATNTVFPKVLNIDDISWENKNSGNMGFESVKKNYDFILFDIERNQEHVFIDRYPIDLIIIPLNPDHNVNTSLRNAVEFNRRTKSNHSRSIVACLLVGITQDYTFDFHYHGLDHYIPEEELNELYEKSKRNRLSHERHFTELNDIKKLGIYVFETYSSDVYKTYENEHVEKHGFYSMGYHFLDEPNTLSGHQLRGIKNEIKRLLSIFDNLK